MKATCKCGRKMNKHAQYCTKCYEARSEERRVKALAHVTRGTCPRCGSPLRRNLALAGWWQCEQFGTEGFRARSNDPSCEFQTFTE